LPITPDVSARQNMAVWRRMAVGGSEHRPAVDVDVPASAVCLLPLVQPCCIIIPWRSCHWRPSEASRGEVPRCHTLRLDALSLDTLGVRAHQAHASMAQDVSSGMWTSVSCGLSNMWRRHPLDLGGEVGRFAALSSHSTAVAAVAVFYKGRRRASIKHCVACSVTGRSEDTQTLMEEDHQFPIDRWSREIGRP
jgi:hypothetical protein